MQWTQKQDDHGLTAQLVIQLCGGQDASRYTT